MPPMRVALWLATVVVLGLSSASCGPTVDLTMALEVQDVSTGWLDTGVVNGQNKLVPSITFKLKNMSDQPLPVLQMNVLFRRDNEDAEWGSGFVTVSGSEGLAPGATSPSLTVNSQLGYTSSDPRQQMLSNSQFVDARVRLFGKYASTQWVKVGEYPVTRRLIVQ
jgi:hypothetical protein